MGRGAVYNEESERECKEEGGVLLGREGGGGRAIGHSGKEIYNWDSQAWKRQWSREVAKSEGQRAGYADPWHWVQRQRGRGGETGIRYIVKIHISTCMIQVPLSSYSQNDILEAFRKKIKEKVVTKKSTAAMQDVHESYQVSSEPPLKTLPDRDESEGIEEEILNDWERRCAAGEVHKLHGPGLHVTTTLGKPASTNSCSKRGGSNPCSKILLQILYNSEGLLAT